MVPTEARFMLDAQSKGRRRVICLARAAAPTRVTAPWP